MTALATSLLALFIMAATVRASRHLGLVDHPDARKQHVGAIPLTGGVGIFLSVILICLVMRLPTTEWPLMTIAFGLFLMGLVDDIRGLRATTRLGAELLAGALLATWAGLSLSSLGNLFGWGAVELPVWVGVPLTALAVAALCNAYNMIDGIDGLAGVTLAVPIAVLYLLALETDPAVANAFLMLLAPIGVFLLFNFAPAGGPIPKLFLGDNGSITLAFLVAASLIYSLQAEVGIIKPVTALWLVALPTYDMLSTMVLRARQGRGLMQADRSHLHYSLIALGFKPWQALALLAAGCVGTAALGVYLERLPQGVSLQLFIVGFALHCTLAAFLANRAQPGRQLYCDTLATAVTVGALMLAIYTFPVSPIGATLQLLMGVIIAERLVSLGAIRHLDTQRIKLTLEELKRLQKLDDISYKCQLRLLELEAQYKPRRRRRGDFDPRSAGAEELNGLLDRMAHYKTRYEQIAGLPAERKQQAIRNHTSLYAAHAAGFTLLLSASAGLSLSVLDARSLVALPTAVMAATLLVAAPIALMGWVQARYALRKVGA